MDDFNTTIDGVAIEVHATDGGKVVYTFPSQDDLKVTVEAGGIPTNAQAERVGAAILSALRSSGLLKDGPSNPRNETEEANSLQGRSSN